MELVQDAHTTSALIALGTQRAHVCPSHLTSLNRSVGQEKEGVNKKSSCSLFLRQVLSTIAGMWCKGLNKVITICLSQGTSRCCHVGRPCTANRPGGGTETQMTRTPSNKRAGHPTKNTTAPFQVGFITIRCVKWCLIYGLEASFKLY